MKAFGACSQEEGERGKEGEEKQRAQKRDFSSIASFFCTFAQINRGSQKKNKNENMQMATLGGNISFSFSAFSGLVDGVEIYGLPVPIMSSWRSQLHLGALPHKSISSSQGVSHGWNDVLHRERLRKQTFTFSVGIYGSKYQLKHDQSQLKEKQNRLEFLVAPLLVSLRPQVLA